MVKRKNKPKNISPPKKGSAPTGTTQQKRTMVAQLDAQQFSGPLPHPQILAQYNQAVPNAADRIIKMAESQSNHRH